MRFLVSIEGSSCIVNGKQLETITKVLENCELVEDKHMGTNLGTHGYNMAYIHEIKPYNLLDNFKVKVYSDDTYDAIKLVTKLNKEETK